MSYTQLAAGFEAGITHANLNDYSEDVTAALGTGELPTTERVSFKYPTPRPVKSGELSYTLEVTFDTNAEASYRLRDVINAALNDNTTGVSPGDPDAREPGEVAVRVQEYTNGPWHVGWWLPTNPPKFGGTANAMRSATASGSFRYTSDPDTGDFS